VSTWISAIEALGTLAIAALAIWGDWFRWKLLSPRLRIELADPRGELIEQVRPILEAGEWRQETTEARYYHLRVSNDKRFAVAHEAQAVMASIEREGPNAQPQTVYTVALPLTWRNQRELDPRPTRNVGGIPHESALFFVRQDGLFLTPMVVPNNLPSRYPSGSRVVLWVTVQARSLEADSEASRFQIAWDGIWERGEAEMSRHLVVTPVLAPTPRRG
jgi:hypothetical protein